MGALNLAGNASLLALLAILGGCAANPPGSSSRGHHPTPSMEISLDTSLFERIDDPALVDSARFGEGKGGLFQATAYRVKPSRSVSIHRVFDKSPFGRWWTLSLPSGSRQAYRQAFAICPQWNNLDSLVSCTLEEGTRVVVGPGESVDCRPGVFPRSDSLQVFLNGAAAFARNCHKSPLIWP